MKYSSNSSQHSNSHHYR